MLKNKKGQSTLEYVILVTAVIVVIITLVVANDSAFRQTMNVTYNTAIDGVNQMSDRLMGSYNFQP